MSSGDSHTETCFDLDGVQPNHQNPLGNPQWPGRTGNYGPNFVGHMTGTFNESFVETYNFAIGESTFRKRWNQDGSDTTIALSQQVEDMFLLRYGKGSEGGGFWHPKNALFVFYIGLDDIVSEFLARQGTPRNATEEDLNIQEYHKNLESV